MSSGDSKGTGSNSKLFLGQARISEFEIPGSTLVKKVWYDSLMGTMRVYLINGYAYEYAGVETETVTEFVNATSIGRYFNNIIARNYKHKRIDQYQTKEE